MTPPTIAPTGVPLPPLPLGGDDEELAAAAEEEAAEGADALEESSVDKNGTEGVAEVGPEAAVEDAPARVDTGKEDVGTNEGPSLTPAPYRSGYRPAARTAL